MYDVLTQVVASSSSIRPSLKYIDPPHIKKMIAQRRVMAPGEYRALLSSHILSARRLARAQWLSNLHDKAVAGDPHCIKYLKGRSMSRPSCDLMVKNCGGKARAVEEVKQYTFQVFGGQPNPGLAPDVQDETQAIKSQCSQCDAAPFTEAEVLHQISNMQANNTSGPSGLSNDGIKAVVTNYDGLQLVVHMLNTMLIAGDLPAALKMCSVILLPKVQEVVKPSQMRPINLVESLHKLYAALLTSRLRSVWPQYACQLGAMPNSQVLDALGAAYHLMQRESIEGTHGLWIKLDIQGAFDSVSYLTLVQHIRRCTPQPYMLEALRFAELLMEPEMTFQWEGETWSLFPSRGVQQGGSHSSFLFGHIMGKILQETFQSWKDSGHEIPYNIFGWCFVDDVLTRMQSWKQADTLLPSLLDRLAAAGLRVNAEKCAVITSPLVLRQADETLQPRSLLRQFKYTSRGQYLRKTLAYDYRLGGDGTVSDWLLSFMHQTMFATLAMSKTIINKMSWNSPQLVLQHYAKYISAKWLWVSPLIQPLASHLHDIDVMQTTVIGVMLGLFIPAHLSDRCSYPLHILRRHFSKQLMRLSSAQCSVVQFLKRKWRYGGHMLRKHHTDIARQALLLGQQDDAAPFRQMQGGPWNTYIKWLLKMYCQLTQQSECSVDDLTACAQDRKLRESYSYRLPALHAINPSWLAYSPFACLRDCLQAVVPWHHTIFMKHSNRGLDFLYLHEQEGMQIMHSDTADLVEAITWQVGWFRLEHPVFALSISVCDDVYDSCVCDIPRLVCNIWRRYEVVVQITVVPTSWVHQIESLF